MEYANTDLMMQSLFYRILNYPYELNALVEAHLHRRRAAEGFDGANLNLGDAALDLDQCFLLHPTQDAVATCQEVDTSSSASTSRTSSSQPTPTTSTPATSISPTPSRNPSTPCGSRLAAEVLMVDATTKNIEGAGPVAGAEPAPAGSGHFIRCRWGKDPCDHIFDTRLPNDAFLSHMRAVHGEDARLKNKNGLPSRKTVSSGHILCRWEGCKKSTKIMGKGIKRHIMKEGHVHEPCD